MPYNSLEEIKQDFPTVQVGDPIDNSEWRAVLTQNQSVKSDTSAADKR